MNKDHEMMTDKELDTLLAHASRPELPAGARQRLLDRVGAEGMPAASNVIPFRRPVQTPAAAPVRSRLGWLASLPLAASLALGIYLGAGGTFAGLLPTTAYDIIAGGSADDSITGIEDVESYTEDDLS